jgi:putative NADH-flavin reductase
MNVIVFGSTGGTGRHLVDLALAQGHTVTAFARNPAALALGHAKLRVVQGDVMDASAVEGAVRGHQAVLSAIGAGAKRSTVRAEGTRNIVRGMEKAGVRRLVSQSSIGVGDSRGNLTFLLTYVIGPLFLRHAFSDHEVQERYIRESRLDWIIVRPGNLTNGARTGLYRHGFPVTDRTTKLKISRADVADFMLKQLTDDTYLHKTAGVSY